MLSQQFKLVSDYQPAGDQPQAIAELLRGLKEMERTPSPDGVSGRMTGQTLLGVTGSGKTFTVANVIAKIQKPTLVIAHNKTLAAQLCNEFRHFFPDNAVHYFVSYYDYYQPEAYVPGSDTYIDKEATINEEIDRLRHAATQALLTRQDVIIVASVSCIYGLGSPANYQKVALPLRRGGVLTREELMQKLIDLQFNRTNADLTRATFRVRGEYFELMPANEAIVYRIRLKGGVVTDLQILNQLTRAIMESPDEILLFPAKHFVTPSDDMKNAFANIRAELQTRLDYFKKAGKLLEAERLERRTNFDLELMEQIGTCHGIENYSRHLSGKTPGEPPDALLDYFPEDFLMVIDESHMTVPQLGGMYEGDRARKQNLVDYGFRLPSALDNRPLKFNEFDRYMRRVIFTSATPGPYEKNHSARVVEQIVRPTGLIDPEVIIVPVNKNKDGGGKTQIEDLLERIPAVLKRHERVLVTTLTKKMAEDLNDYLLEKKIKSIYLHSEVDTLERIKIITDFRKGKYDILVGVNLLREGLDLPEVSLVAILDADKEGFLRSETSLIQTIGRAARNVLGQVILYADTETGSIKRAVDENNRRREIQMAYNKKHSITPATIKKEIRDMLEEFVRSSDRTPRRMTGRSNKTGAKEVIDLELAGDTRPTAEIIKEKKIQMKTAAQDLEFELAALLRDQIRILEKQKLKTKRSVIPS